MKCSISILITYYNEKELLTRCINSLLSQTIPIYEILIHDDASKFCADQYFEPAPHIRVIRSNSNRGPSAARNLLLSQARGNYIHFHDADDFFDSNWAEKVESKIKETDTDVVFTEVDSYRHGNLHREKILDLKKIQNGMSLVDFSLNHALLPLSGTYRRSLIKRLGGYREELWQSEDFEFHVRLALSEARFEIISRSLAFIDIRDDSRSQKQLEVWQWRLSALRLLFLDLPPQFYPTFIEALCATAHKLFELRDHHSSSLAYNLIMQLGTPRYSGRSLLFRLLAKFFGPFKTEIIGKSYRNFLPESVRRRLRGPDYEIKFPPDSVIDDHRKAS